MTPPGGMDERVYRALVKADRSAALAAAAAAAARELNDLLTRIMASSAAGPGAPAAIEAAVVEAREVTRRLALLSRADAPASAAGRFAPGEILRAAVAAAAAEQAAEITVAAAPDVAELAGDGEELVQAIRILVRNAAEAMSPPPPRPRIQVQARNVALAEGEVEGLASGAYVEIEVRDNGHGIAPENLQRIWEPLFTTRRHATGVGLPTLLAIVRRHGGQVGVDSVPGEGSVFTVYLPAAPAPAAGAGGIRASAARFRTGRVLVHEPDDQLRAHTAGLLQRLDYSCDASRDGEEAVAWYRRYLEVGRPYDAVLLPLRSAGGAHPTATVAALRELDPDVRTVALSAEPPDSLAEAAAAAGFTGWLAKPFTLRELGEVLQTVAGQ